MAYLVDSSVWVALFLDFDAQHKKAVRFFDDLIGTLYIPYCVINEVATVIAYKHSKQQANNFLTFIENNSDISIIDDDAKEEALFYKSIPNKISFTDAALVRFSKKLPAEFITFDKQLFRIVKKG